MTELEALQAILAVLESIEEFQSLYIFIGQSIALGVGLIWGAISWFLVQYAFRSGSFQ